MALIEILASGMIDASGDPLDSGVAYVYQVGTTTKLTVYSDKDMTQPVSNPITLDAAGRAEVYVGQACRLVVEDSSGNAIDDIASVGTATSSSTSSSATTATSDQIPPIGSIIPFYDFDGALTFDTDYWAYCDGSAATVNGVARNTPDLSNRYLVGFGTEGGNDIDSAAWATAVVGNSGHTTDSSHVHSGPSHTHTGPSHTHNVAEYYESGSTKHVKFYKGTYGGGTYYRHGYTAINMDNTGSTYGRLGNTTVGSISNGDDFISSASGTGATGASGTGDTGSGGSATLDIQPRSIRVRFIMRLQ